MIIIYCPGNHFYNTKGEHLRLFIEWSTIRKAYGNRKKRQLSTVARDNILWL